MILATYVIVSVLIISFISFIGVFTLGLRRELLHKVLIYLVGFSAGALLGDAFLHLLPESLESLSSLQVSMYILAGILIFFIIEKFLQWEHHHHAHEKEVHEHGHVFAKMNLFGDAAHNFLDGLIIAGAYLTNIPLGISTTIAVIAHEIPQEIGDFAVLIHGGYNNRKALWFNFLSAITAIAGAVVALVLSSRIENIALGLSSFAIGGFIYIANSDLIPELHKEKTFARSWKQLLAILLGVAAMAALLLLE
ncbi:MAG: ZIP family metal transporter [Nanoarchaeota archaeon]|nr:ZIP family metal transporter [Nanoarchaeota archaeon]